MLAAVSGATTRGRHFDFGGPQILIVVVLVLLIALAGFLALSETALTRMSRIRATSLADEGRRGGHTLKRLVEHPEKFLNPLLLCILICHIVSGVLVSILFESIGPLGVATGVGLEIGVIFVVAESWPKTWAVQNADRAALRCAPFIAVVVSFPPLQFLARLLAKLAPGDDSVPATSEQELLAFADAALEEDVIEGEERSMIHSVIEFGDTVVREVMVPRTDMVTVEADATVAHAIDVAIAAGFSRIPVTRGSKDDIAGIAYAKDLMRAQRDHRADVAVVNVTRPARFAPESRRVSEVMREMQAQKFHLAIVVDEYGGTAGIVTLEDLIEELVGDIVDEYDTEEVLFDPQPNGDIIVTGRMLIDELNPRLDVDWSSEHFDTVGGLVLHELGHPASEGEQVEFDGRLLRAERVKSRRILRVRIAQVGEPRSHDDERSSAAGRS